MVRTTGLKQSISCAGNFQFLVFCVVYMLVGRDVMYASI
jgi:hypothetical protein